MISSESRMREIRTSGLMSGGLETGPRETDEARSESEESPRNVLVEKAPCCAGCTAGSPFGGNGISLHQMVTKA